MPRGRERAREREKENRWRSGWLVYVHDNKAGKKKIDVAKAVRGTGAKKGETGAAGRSFSMTGRAQK